MTVHELLTGMRISPTIGRTTSPDNRSDPRRRRVRRSVLLEGEASPEDISGALGALVAKGWLNVAARRAAWRAMYELRGRPARAT